MVAILSKFIGKGVSKARKARKRPAPTPSREKSAATIANEKRQMARQTKGTRALKALQLEAQRKAKDAKRGVDKKKQAAVKKRIAAKPAVRKRKQQDAQIAAIKKERKTSPVQKPQGREGQAITTKNKNPDAVFTSGDNEIVAGLKSSPSIRDNITNAQKKRAEKIVTLEKKVREGTATSAEKTELKKLDKINRDDTSRAAKSAADTRNKPARKARLKAALNRMGGGKVVKKDMRAAVRNIKASDVDKERSARIVSKKAEATRAKNNPKKKSSSTKLPVNLFPDGLPYESYKKESMINAKGGGKVKGYKKGGPITYRMSGGQVVGNSYD